MRTLLVFLVGLVALILMVAATESRAVQIPFSQAKIIFEFNSSGPDLGIQVSLDGEPWKLIKIVDPKGRTLLEIEAKGRLKGFGLTELFAESDEPNFADVPAADILERFPAGIYEFFGKTVEGDKLVGTATLTHDIPNGPSNVLATPTGSSFLISWTAPTDSLAGQSAIVGYQVIVERTDNDQLGAAPRTFDIKLPATSAPTQSVTVPPEFLEAGTEYKFEVLAIEAGGNQTITEGGPFVTAPQLPL
jgi:hypothetical protein